MKELKDYDVIELLDTQAQQYELLIQAQGNLRAIRAEIERRKNATDKQDITGV